MDKEKRKENKKKESFYAKISGIKRAFYSNKPMFVLLYKEVFFNLNDLDSSLSSVVSYVLQEFEDIFPEDGPSGLPPFRSIEHHIDFYPRATIPNRPAYRTNPEETKELQHQVEELMAKGQVRESLSLY